MVRARATTMLAWEPPTAEAKSGTTRLDARSQTTAGDPRASTQRLELVPTFLGAPWSPLTIRRPGAWIRELTDEMTGRRPATPGRICDVFSGTLAYTRDERSRSCCGAQARIKLQTPRDEFTNQEAAELGPCFRAQLRHLSSLE